MKANWIDIQNPSPAELAALKAKFGFHQVIIDELLVPSVRSRIETYDNYLFFIYNFPIFNPLEQTSRRAEIDFLITADTVITIHYEPIPPFAELHNFSAETPFDLLYALLIALFRFEERQLHHIGEKLELIGDNLFKNKEKEILRQISFLRRDASEYRMIVRSAESVLHSLRDHGVTVWGTSSRVYLNDLVGEHLKVLSRIEDYRETLEDFELTNSRIMDMKTNSTVKMFTAMSFLTFPFVLLVALFDMHLHGNPLSDLRYGFWVVFGLVVIGIGSLALYFSRKDWL